MGGGARYPYPKAVWSPAGGWWTRPSNWRANTAIAFAGIIGVTYGVWNLSADKEVRVRLFLIDSNPPALSSSLHGCYV
ncbi:hypothetical protein BJ322DRAFT_1080985 [Thelephora terrestris]|uniref:Uncharacterized protein n=1 Tax=Thelephora terrestris TaxID=56493 RepID=A0A9P6H803_9AGAM|nr:hypothetical protein BJ322DRAFT_1080985 [Thelephora terrestris]